MGELLDRDRWLKAQGFEKDPFRSEARQAEGDVLLHPKGGSAFVNFPYYQEIKGDKNTRGPQFVFAARGGGKTALRMHLQHELDQELRNGIGRIITINYDNFDLALTKAGHDPSKIRPRDHVEAIVTLIVKRLFELFTTEPELDLEWKSIQNEHVRRLLVWYVETFGMLYPWQINRALGEIEGLKHFIGKEQLVNLGKVVLDLSSTTLPVPAQRLVSFFNGMVGIERLPEADPSSMSMYDLLDGIILVCRELGFKAIYVLVDDVDEPQYYGRQYDFKPAFDLIRPLASASKLIGTDLLVFKFFLPMEIRKTCLSSLRLDKYTERIITWKHDDLKKVLTRRLLICTNGDKTSLQDICSQEFDSPMDELLVDFAKEVGSPRGLLYVGHELLAEFFRKERDIDERISRATWEHARQRAEEVLQ